MDACSDAASLPSSGGRALTARPGGSRARRGTAPAEPPAMLELREEATHAKQQQRAAEDKMRHLAAQLARTEEAAKRILTRTDPTARGGVAQRLLDAERELVAARAELAEQGSQLARAKRQAVDRKAQAAELKSRLDAALASQRHLALQLGRLQAGACLGGCRSAAARTVRLLDSRAGEDGGPGELDAPRGCAAGSGSAQPLEPGAEAEAAAARRFAVQQEQLAAALERRAQLEQQVRQQQAALGTQGRELAELRAQTATSRATAGSGAAGLSQQHQHQQLRAPVNGQQRRARSEDSEGGGEGSASWLRLKYLESRSALERSTSSNSRLLRELEAVRGQVQRLQQEVEWWRQREQELQGPAQREWPRGGPHSSERRAPAGLAAAAHQEWQQQQEGEPSPDGGSSWWRGATSVLDEASAPSTARGHGVGSREQDQAPAPPTALVLQLRQQLAGADHRAARLQIELDAALAKLCVYQEWEAQLVQRAPQDQQARAQRLAVQHHSSLGHCHGQQACEAEQGGVSPRPLRPLQLRPAGDQLEPRHAGSWCGPGRSPGRGMAGTAAASSVPEHGCMPAWGPEAAGRVSVAGPAVVELHLCSAELEEGALAPWLPGAKRLSGALTFLTADLPGFATAMTPVVQGPSPAYNATLQFAVDGRRQPLAGLAAGRARLELHCCTASISGAAGYTTVASAWIPLASLLADGSPSPATAQPPPQLCTLYGKDGAAVGSLVYALRVQHSAK